MTTERFRIDVEGRPVSAAWDEAPGASAVLALGYAGWSPGQLENELRLNAWVVCPFERATADLAEQAYWKGLLARHRPDLRLVLDSPEIGRAHV